MIDHSICYFDSKDKLAGFQLAERLSKLLLDHKLIYETIIVLCIGTDRVTGDSLGPLVGYKLSKSRLHNVKVYGTLENPVHALNLADTTKEIYKKYSNPFIIAIDASLGNSNHLGYITLGKGPLTPGSGVKKTLLPVGDIFITGIVNVSGVLDNLVLQTTRLDTVMTLADCISLGIRLAERNDYFTCILPNGKCSQLGVKVSK
ncbi:MAG: spore protease YyaC [Candidatus Galacturonibacter soehngenii]|uniref:Spore protease YyaC n=1 Tax=Candidatus Galacturonatibacter soehngenii TaxID=2307010 RepID=A0A7V7UBA5_9FIRM|nr:spore protease YyaC [Candidatus Galacturonibacter soehngenii]MBA4689124.1 spore protease YyaC [Candidatus Galacturonibacter soehngenii]